MRNSACILKTLVESFFSSEDIQKTVFSVIDESRFTVNYKEPEVILLVVLIKV